MDTEGLGLTDKDRGVVPGDSRSQDASVQAPEPQAEVEQTLEQKIGVLVGKVREVNSQLGGKVAAEVSTADRTTFFFANAAPAARRGYIVYGVDSVQGPVYVSGDLSKKLLRSANRIDFQQASTVTPDEITNWVHGDINSDQMREWGMAFEDSKNTVLRDKLEMQRIRAAQTVRVDSALEIVSKPIDIGSGANKQPEVSETRFGVAHAVPEDRASMDRESADRAALEAQNTLGHSQ